MIVADDTQFPQNVVELLVDRYSLLDADFAGAVFARPLNPTDPVQAIGVVATQWTPNQETLEMRGIGKMEPSLNQYLVTVQAYIKDMDEERGLNVHSVLSRRVRSILYNDVVLREALIALSATLDGKVEKIRRWGVRQQRFVSNELDSVWLYLSILEFWFETETM